MRAFLETIGARGLITIIGMVIFLLAAAHFAYQRDNHEAAILWCLVMAILLVGGYLWWLLESTLHDGMDAAAHIAWEVGYSTALADKLYDRERAGNPYRWPSLLEENGDE